MEQTAKKWKNPALVRQLFLSSNWFEIKKIYKIVFLLPNTISIIQHLDQGIIWSFTKFHYRKIYLLIELSKKLIPAILVLTLYKQDFKVNQRDAILSFKVLGKLLCQQWSLTILKLVDSACKIVTQMKMNGLKSSSNMFPSAMI